MKKEFVLELKFETGQRIYQYTLVKDNFDILSRKIGNIRIEVGTVATSVRYMVDDYPCKEDTIYETAADAEEAAIANLTAKRLRDNEDDDEDDEDEDDEDEDDEDDVKKWPGGSGHAVAPPHPPAKLKKPFGRSKRRKS